MAAEASVQEPVPAAGRDRSPGRGLSLGAKFVGLIAGLILLLSATGFISLHQSGETVRQFQDVVQFAIPAYRALARSHIRSLQQGLELRRALLLAEVPDVPASLVGEHVQRYRVAQIEFNREFADAGQMIRQQRDSGKFESASAELQSVLDQLDALVPVMQQHERESTACLAAITARDIPEARRRLEKIDTLREELGARLETARSDMGDALKTIAADAAAAQDRARWATIVVFVLASGLGFMVATVGAVRLIQAIRSVVRGTEAVEKGNLETHIEVLSRDEIGQLAASFNRMVDGLRMRDLIRETFGKYVDRRVAEQLIGSRDLLAERGGRREVVVMFCDLKGFTALSERIEAGALVQFLNAFFSIIAREIAATDGVIDKFIGDSVMAYWCPPFVPAREIAWRAAEAALRCTEQRKNLKAASRTFIGDGTQAYNPRIRIGIATGEGITGSIGAEDRRNYTVIGGAANLASRIEGVNRVYGTGNLVCSRTAEAIRGQCELREIDSVLLPGIDAPQKLFEILGRAGRLSPAMQALRTGYAGGLDAYRRGDWATARKEFGACLELEPEDGPSQTMLARIEKLATLPAASLAVGSAWRLGKESLG